MGIMNSPILFLLFNESPDMLFLQSMLKCSKKELSDVCERE